MEPKCEVLTMSSERSVARGQLSEKLDKPTTAEQLLYKQINIEEAEKSAGLGNRSEQDISDDELVKQFVAGSEFAFRQLVERYEQRVRAIAFGVVRNPEEAEDLAQEAFLKLYKYLPSFKGESSFYTWFYRIVLNLGIDYTRKKKRRSSVFIDKRAYRGDDYSPERDMDFADEGDPGLELQRKELRQRINEAMEQLSADHRMVIMLREVDGLSYQEISEVVGCNKGTVMSRLHHARKRLQKILTPFLGEGH